MLIIQVFKLKYLLKFRLLSRFFNIELMPDADLNSYIDVDDHLATYQNEEISIGTRRFFCA